MAKTDLINVDGRISYVSGGDTYTILLENGVSIRAKLSGRMMKYRIRVLLGDLVTVGVSPFDPSHGIIVHRKK